MRKTYHLCLSSHDEVLFRSKEDFIRGFNCFAEAIFLTESRALADGEMTTHLHFGIQTDNYKQVMYLSRFAYSRYFNNKYCRKGRLGEKQYFCLEVNGVRHMTACVSYVMRQGLHHGLSETPFGYEYCSSNVIFQKQLGKSPETDLLPDKSKYKFLSGNANSKDYSGYRMSSSGLLLREDVIDTSYVEEIYLTPKNFLYNMTRQSDEKWVQEQKEENPKVAPVTLDIIENGVPDSEINHLKSNERGRVDYTPIRDLELCSMIDNQYLPAYFKEGEERSVYLLPVAKRAEIGNSIWIATRSGRSWSTETNGRVTVPQIRRCLALDHDSK